MTGDERSFDTRDHEVTERDADSGSSVDSLFLAHAPDFTFIPEQVAVLINPFL